LERNQKRITAAIMMLLVGGIEMGLGLWSIYFVIFVGFSENDLDPIVFLIGLILVITGLPGMISGILTLKKKDGYQR
jgi:NO-binding membrane sensor protein with MHYT domain